MMTLMTTCRCCEHLLDLLTGVEQVATVAVLKKVLPTVNNQDANIQCRMKGLELTVALPFMPEAFVVWLGQWALGRGGESCFHQARGCQEGL